jgi:GWxTD domain-containing protein
VVAALEELAHMQYNTKVGKRVYLVLFFALLFVLNISALAQKKRSPKDLDPMYRKWLEEEVVYIITPKEKEVFLQLETDRQRDKFIEAFWKVRDTNPNTPENEFKTEHYRRIQYANRNFGKEAPGQGWRSDMGRIYIILGEPKTVEKFENVTEVKPTVVWFYDGMDVYGLPNSFNVVFFKRDFIGEYILYSPIKYGPQNLLSDYQGDMSDYKGAFNTLFDIEPTLANVSLTLIPSETYYTISPSIASEILIGQKIPQVGYQQVKDEYAAKLLAYKDIIEVDYSANYIDSDSLVRVFQDPAGMFFVHYLIEPKKLTFEKLEDIYQSNLVINGSVKDLSGKTIYQFERNVPIKMNEGQMDNIKTKLFSFQDMFPLVRGQYRFNVLFKNVVSKEFSSVEADLTIPETSSLQMSPLTLANRIDKNSQYKGQNKPFLMENIQLVPSPRNDFLRQDTLTLFFQVQGLSQSLIESGTLEYALFKENEKVLSFVKNIKEYPSQKNFFEEFSLADLVPANYKIKVSVLDKNQAEILSEQSYFYITQLVALPRPWVLSLPKPHDNDPEMLNILGNEFFNKQDISKARTLLQEAYRRDPDSDQLAMDFCRVLLLTKEYQLIKQVALPFAKDKKRYEFLKELGQASQALGEYAEAIASYKDYLTRFGTNINVLNAIGDCYYQLGNISEALVAWDKSLQISPEQDKIRERVKAAREKK